MPVYEYQCKACGRDFEYQQRMSDADKTTCEACGGALDRLISRTAFALKGGGWYKDLYASPKPEGGDKADKADKAAGGDAKADGKGADKAAAKADAPAASADKAAAKPSSDSGGSSSGSGSGGGSSGGGSSGGGSSGGGASSGSVAKVS
jgi:putative FmdB family regulatory protein